VLSAVVIAFPAELGGGCHSLGAGHQFLVAEDLRFGLEPVVEVSRPCSRPRASKSSYARRRIRSATRHARGRVSQRLRARFGELSFLLSSFSRVRKGAADIWPINNLELTARVVARGWRDISLPRTRSEVTVITDSFRESLIFDTRLS